MSKRINTTYDIVKAFEAIEDELIGSMIGNMDRHRAEETKEGYNWSQWQVEQLASLEEYKRMNKKKYGSKFKDINGAIDVLISEQRAAGNASQEIAILNAIKKGQKAHKNSAGITGEFFKLNDRKMDALIDATKNDLKKAEQAMLRMANDRYRKIIFNAQAYAASGATYAKAVDMATRDFLAAGINCVEYKNGARHTVSDYADMCLRTANKRAYLTGEGEKRKEWGISTVIMNKRGNPCPKCLPWVGKVLIDDVWSGGKASDGKYPLMSNAMAAGLYHPRCKDSHTTFFPDLNEEPDDVWTREELSEVENNAKKEAKLENAQRQLAKCERIAKYSLDSENKRIYEARAEQWGKVIDEEKQLENVTDTLSSGGNGVVYPINQSVIDKVLLKSVPDLDEDKLIILQESHKRVLKAAMEKNNSMEVALLLDGNMNDIGNFILGTAKEIDLNVPGRSSAVFVIHNHPNNSSFSNIDIAWFVKNSNIKYFSIVKNNGSVELLYKLQEFDSDTFKIEYKRAVKKYQKNIDKDVQKGYNKVIEYVLTKTKSGLIYVR